MLCIQINLNTMKTLYPLFYNKSKAIKWGKNIRVYSRRKLKNGIKQKG